MARVDKGGTMRKRVARASVLIAGALVVLGSTMADAAEAGAVPVSPGAPEITNWYRVPAAHGVRATRSTWSSSNWSGYAETGHFTSISGAWTVPSASAGATDATSEWFSSAWVGIDGFDNTHLIQTGTEQDFYGGTAHYSAWWEILPKAETVIPYSVLPGNSMSATIEQTATTVTSANGKRSKVVTKYWYIKLQDLTEGWTFATTQVYKGTGSSAEFIVEAPVVGRSISTIAHYAFTPAAAAGGDVNGARTANAIGAALAGAGLSYVNDSGTLIQNALQVSTPGSQDPTATAFNSSYGALVPPAPTG
jgi:hypothetical protein